VKPTVSGSESIKLIKSPWRGSRAEFARLAGFASLAICMANALVFARLAFLGGSKSARLADSAWLISTAFS
jgi:hypothetical protein